MEENTEDTIIQTKGYSVEIKEINTDCANIEAITMSRPLLEFLVKDPVCGRSDYSGLPGVRTDFQSPWRSFAEYPRRTNVRQRGNVSLNAEERIKRNTIARIRRENLTLKRVEKRERLRAQQRERNRQRSLLYKFERQTSEKGDIFVLNPGVILSSPSKVPAGKLWKDKKICSKRNKNTIFYSVIRNYTGDSDIGKPVHNTPEKLHFDSSASKLHTFLDEVVSTTSLNQADECIQREDKHLKSSPEASKLHVETFNIDNFLFEKEDKSVTSSQDSTEKSVNNVTLKFASINDSNPSVNPSWTVSSTTAPEIVDADSSTPRTLKRRTRNCKRINYAEMLDDDDFDVDDDEQFIRESKTSGRKIRPVKRILENAIVDASLKKSPRKKKSFTESKNIQSTLFTISETECDTFKNSNFDLLSSPISHDLLETTSIHEADVSLDCTHTTLPNVSSANTLVQTLPTSSLAQHKIFMQTLPESSVAQNQTLVQTLPASSLAQRQTFVQTIPASNVAQHQTLVQTLPASNLAQHQTFVQTIPASIVAQHQTLVQTLPASNVPQHQSLMSLSSASSLNLNNPGNLPVGPMYISNPFESNKSVNATITRQPNLIRLYQQPLSVPLTNNIPQNFLSVITPSSVHNVTFGGGNNFSNLIIQPPFINSLPNHNPHVSNNYIVSNCPPSQEKISHTYPANVQPFPLACGMNQSGSTPPILLESHMSPSTPSSNQHISIGAPKYITQQVPFLNKNTPNSNEHNLIGALNFVAQQSPSNTIKQFSKSAKMSYKNKPNHPLPVDNVNVPQERTIASSNPAISDLLKKNNPNAENLLAQEKAQVMSNHLEKGSTRNVSQNNSSKKIHQNLAVITGSDNTKDKAEASTAKTQLKVAAKLSSVFKNVTDEKNILNSVSKYFEKEHKNNNTVKTFPPWLPKKMNSEKILFSQILDSFPTQDRDCLNTQTLTTQIGNQSSQASCDFRIGPPPPLISISELSQLQTKTDSYDIKNMYNQQTVVSNVYAVHSTSPTCVASSETVPHQTENSVERSAISSQSSSRTTPIMSQPSTRTTPITSQSSNQNTPNQFLHNQSVLPQSSYSQVRYPHMQPGSDTKKYVQTNAGCQQANLPALLGFNTLPNLTASGSSHYTKIRMLVPEMSHSIKNKSPPYPHITSSNTLPHRVAAPFTRAGLVQKTSTQTIKHNNTSKSVEGHRLPSHGSSKQEIRPSSQTVHIKNKIPALIPDSIITQMTRPTFNTSGTADFWRLPLFTQESTLRPTSDKSATGLQNQNKTHQKKDTWHCLPRQPNHQRSSSATVQLSTAHQTENAGHGILPTDTSSVQSHSINRDKQVPHNFIVLSVNNSLPNVPSTISTSSATVRLPQKSINVVTQAANKHSPSRNVSRSASSSGVLHASHIKPAVSSLCPLDLRHKIPQAEHVSLTTQASVNPSSVSTRINHGENQVTTAVSTPRVAYDYPLTKSQIKQESFIHPERRESSNQGFIQPDVNCEQHSRNIGNSSVITSMNSSVISTSITTEQNSNLISSQDSNTTNTNTLSKSIRHSSSGDLSELRPINIKMETPQCCEENINSFHTTSTSELFRSAQQIVNTTSGTHVPSTTFLSTPQRSILESSQSSLVLESDQTRLINGDNQISVSANSATVKNATFPTHVTVKHEVQTCPYAESTVTSLSKLQSSSINNKPSSSINTFVVLSTCDNGTRTFNTHITASTLDSPVVTAAKMSVPPTNKSLQKCSNHQSFITENAILSNESGAIARSVVTTSPGLSLLPSIISENISSLPLIETELLQACPESVKTRPVPCLKSTPLANSEPNLENISSVDNVQLVQTKDLQLTSFFLSDYLIHDKIPVDASAEALTCEKTMPTDILLINQDVGRSQNTLNEPSDSNVPVTEALQSTSVFNKQAVDFPVKQYSITNDPLFAWCIDSPKHIETFLLDDIAGPLLSFERNLHSSSNNINVENGYSVTISNPCSDASSSLLASTCVVDLEVKQEPNCQPVTLNQREVIDLCVSDNEEDSPVSAHSISNEQFTSVSINTSFLNTHDTSGITSTVLPVMPTDISSLRKNTETSIEENVTEVKEENSFQCICIDDDSDDDDVIFMESTTQSSNVSHASSNLLKQTTQETNPTSLSMDVASSGSNPSSLSIDVTSTGSIPSSLSIDVASSGTISPSGLTTLLSPNKSQNSPSKSSVTPTSQPTGRVLASVANWSDDQVSEWLKQHKLDRICPNLSNLDGRGLQRMAFEHQRDPSMFYTRVKKTLGLTFFQTLVICQSMKELNGDDTGDDS